MRALTSLEKKILTLISYNVTSVTVLCECDTHPVFKHPVCPHYRESILQATRQAEKTVSQREIIEIILDGHQDHERYPTKHKDCSYRLWDDLLLLGIRSV